MDIKNPLLELAHHFAQIDKLFNAHHLDAGERLATIRELGKKTEILRKRALFYIASDGKERASA
ncbi:MAG: hypothetical protein FWG39_03705 [Alphaproteobacteria bacterium]|nr:hypothetical protein [Alphaproteobacteria bacterium]